MFAGSVDEYLDWVVPGSPAIPVTQHVLGQSVVEYSGGTALAETHVTAYHRLATDEGDRPHPERLKRSPGTKAPLAWADGPARQARRVKY